MKEDDYLFKKLFLDLNNFKPNLGSIERGDSIELNIKLLDSEDYSRSKFRVLGAKSDGKYVEQIEGINLEENDLKVILEDQFVNHEGIVKLELNVASEGTESTTKEFYFFVSNTMNASIIDSADSLPTLEKVSKYVDDAVDNLEALKEASEDITIINSEFKENEIKRKANEMLREKNEKARLQSEDIRITGEEERETNELERIQAENDRKVSESNRKLSENTRKTNERAREEAELSRQSTFEENEEIRNENENLRIASEKERIKFNSEAKTDELNRKESEKNRVLAEEERKSSEEARVSAEAIRQNTYTDFNESEEERKSNEIKRQEAEALRVEAETRRDNLFSEKEEERNTSFIESEKVRNAAFNKAQDSRNTTFEESETIREEAFKISEKARNDAEELRVTSENERTTAERLRVDSEKARVLAEEERNNTFTQNETNRNETFEVAEEERTVAEASRVESENARVEAEKLRVAAETERVEAENLRVTAEEERVAAEIKREEGFNKFEGKINANTEELKNARFATTGEEFNSLDERIDCEVDRLNKKIEVSMLQQEDKESHVVENTIEGMTTDMIIKGRTLNNVKGIVKSIGSHWINSDNKYSLDLPSGSGQPAIIYNLTHQLKKECKYTVIINVLEYNEGHIHLSFMNKSGNAQASTIENVINSIGVKKLVFTTKSDVSADVIRILPRANVNNIYSISKDIMILEGDWTNKPIPEFFEGIKSFGQQEDKISILSNGKNLFNDSLFIGKDIELIKSEYPNFKQSIKLSEGNYCSQIEFTDGSKVMDANFILNAYNEKNTLVRSFLANNLRNLSVEQANKIAYLQLVWNDQGLNFYRNKAIKNISLIKTDTITSGEPYKEDKKDILLSQYRFDEGLRGINSVTDELNSIRNVAIKRIGKREYREGDELLEDIITDKTNTYYVLEEPIETPLNENIELKSFNEKTYVSFENAITGTSSFKAPVNIAATISRLNRENRALEEENLNLRQDLESTTLTLIDSDLELVKQNVDMDFRLMEVEFALDIPQAILSSNIKFKNKKGEVKSMARTPYEMMKIVILSGDYDREDYMHKVGKYYERGRTSKEEHDELMSLMTADEVISK
ncbi:MAG: hypothetical protein E7K00_15830 [Clostridium perfringens]|nr:hypothetical protein [Clostridium perfringens]